ncbi:MAG: ribonuclease [Naasia sp.]|nr:ribonuclease [Naasia sp.]
MVEDNENMESSKRRRRTFLPRRAASASAQAAPPASTDSPSTATGTETPRAEALAKRPSGSAPEVPAEATPEVQAPAKAPATQAPSGPEADSGPPAAEASEPEAPDVPEPEAAQPEPTQPKAAEPQAPQPPQVTGPTTMLVFQAPPALPPLPASAPLVDDEEEQDETETSTTSRRRNRRRPGSAAAAPTGSSDSDQPAEQAPARPRRRVVEEITEPQRIKGSTRLEAKKQRRRDGRDAGRRRAVVTEAEFLARRESVDRAMVVRSSGDRIEIGVLEDGILAEHYVAKSQNQSLIGNVYLGRVQNVLPSMEAAFVDIGRGRNAVLYSGEVDWEAAAENGEKNQPRRIELALKPGDKVLVQVTKDPVGHKGARLTSQVSLPGRYLVYVPNGSMNGISRKLPDTERARLKKILKEVLPDGVGVIVRTAAEGATDEQLTVDVNRLTAQWQHISAQAQKVNAPALLHSEPDLLVKIIRDVFNEDFTRLVIAGTDAQETIEAYLTSVAPDLLDRVEKYTGQGDVFADFRVQEQIDKALERKVWLPSGGSLVIDRTEAMTVIDVNTGKFVGSGGNLEETVTKNNLEAAEEIVRQLRLRDIGGIIVIDFIDMVLETNRDLVLRRLVECLSRDRTKHQVAEVTSLGLVQMTRKKLGLGLAESMTEPSAMRAPDSKQDSRRRKATPPAPTQRPANGSTHAITDDARNALAKIAASTLHKDAHDEATPVVEPVAEPAAATPRTEAAVKEPILALAEPAEKSEAAEKTAPAEKTVPIVPLPEVAAVPRPKVLAKEAESLLDSVLEALPEPKKPGQGRSRSRRVTTAALTPGSPPAE